MIKKKNEITLKDLLTNLVNEKNIYFLDDIKKLKNNTEEIKNFIKKIKSKFEIFENLQKKKILKNLKKNEKNPKKKNLLINDIIIEIKNLLIKEKKNLQNQENFLEKISNFKNNFRKNLLIFFLEENENKKNFSENKNLNFSNSEKICDFKKQIVNLKKLVFYKEKIIQKKKKKNFDMKIFQKMKNVNYISKIMELVQILKLMEFQKNNLLIKKINSTNTDNEIISLNSEISKNKKNSKNLKNFIKKIKTKKAEFSAYEALNDKLKQDLVVKKNSEDSHNQLEKVRVEEKILNMKNFFLKNEKKMNHKINYLNYFIRTYFKEEFEKIDIKKIIYNFKKRFNKFKLIKKKNQEFICEFNDTKQIRDIIKFVVDEKIFVDFEKDFKIFKFQNFKNFENFEKKKILEEKKIFLNFEKKKKNLKKKFLELKKKILEFENFEKKEIIFVKDLFCDFVKKNEINFLVIKILKEEYNINFENLKKSEISEFLKKNFSEKKKKKKFQKS